MSNSKLKIVHFCNSLHLGGVEIMSTQKLIDFKALGHEVTMCTYEDGYASKYLTDADIHIEYCKNREHAIGFIKEFSADIIHGQSCGGGSEGVEVGRQLGIIHGETIHSMAHGSPLGNFEVVYNDINHRNRPGSTLIYWGFNVDRLKPTLTREEARERWGIPKDVYLIARNGRLDGSKAPADFIETLARLPEWVWGLCGGWGPEGDNLMRQAHRLNVLKRLKFTGAQYSVGDTFVGADCIVYPTHDESFCAGVIEPRWQWKPVVCYVRGGMAQHCIHEETCLVGNSPDELASHVTRLIQDTQLAADIGRKGYEICEKHGYWDHMRDAKQHIELYTKVLNERKM